jgi:hypothetical protein
LQDVTILDNLETKHFVLIHGGGFGAWCWYKSIALLEEAGFVATALDLTGSGIDHTQTNSISTLAQYVKPLLDYLETLPESDKVSKLVTSDDGIDDAKNYIMLNTMSSNVLFGLT